MGVIEYGRGRVCDDRRSIIISATQEADAGRRACARRSRRAPQGRGSRRHAEAEGISGSEGPGTDALWRLGAQGHRLRLLSTKNRLALFADSAVDWEYVPIRENKYLPARPWQPLAALVLGGAALGIRARRGG